MSASTGCDFLPYRRKAAQVVLTVLSTPCSIAYQVSPCRDGAIKSRTRAGLLLPVHELPSLVVISRSIEIAQLPTLFPEGDLDHLRIQVFRFYRNRSNTSGSGGVSSLHKMVAG